MENSAIESSVLIDITDSEFQELAQLVYSQFGINLTDKKKALVRGRLNKVLRNKGLKSFREYLNWVRSDALGGSLVELIDRISTNHSFFFREAEHFTFLTEQVLPELMQQQSVNVFHEIRIWCAGCASGEEAYTLSMLCHDWAQQHGYQGKIKILATDISVSALELAMAGQYTSEKVRFVPKRLKDKYLRQINDDLWEVQPILKPLILFKRLNFMDPTFPFRNQFHAIFCRNVMIYFDRQTKNDLVQRLSRVLLPGQYFFIGHSESLGRETFDFQYVKPSVYRKVVS